jgi:hypothetical protein
MRPGAIGGYRPRLDADGTVLLRLDRMAHDGVRKGDRLEVRYRREDPDDPTSAPIAINEVRLILPSGAAPSDIRRFGWVRWLAVADAVARWRPNDDSLGVAITDAGTRALRLEGTLRKRRPGRRGHPAEFYKKIADRYIDLTARGARNPRAQIASETGKSIDTVAGWLRRARELGYLAQPTRMRRRT